MTRLACSFCSKEQDEVKHLIAGPGVCICNECVALCQEIFVELDGEAPARPAEEMSALTADVAPTSAPTIPIRVDMVEKLHKIGRAERKLVTELRREPTLQEIADVTGIEPGEVDSIKRAVQKRVSR